MNENNNENGNSQIPEIEELVIDEGDDAETIAEKVKEHNQKVKDRDQKVKETNAQLYARTKKAEGFELVDNKWVKPAVATEKKPETGNSEGLKAEDVFTLIQAGVPKEDVADVQEFASFKKISIAEALLTPTVKTILADKAEARKVADGTNTGGARRGNAKLSDDALKANADKGIMPESDEDIARLNNLRWGKK